MTSVTCSNVAPATPYRSLMTFDTVDTETPASAATCCMVTRRPAPRGGEAGAPCAVERLAVIIQSDPAPMGGSALDRALQPVDDATLQRKEEDQSRDHRDRSEGEHACRVG